MSDMKKVISSSLEFGNISLFNEHTHGSQWFVLKLDCGHIVGRYTRPVNEVPPKKVRCEYCNKNETVIQKNLDYTSDSICFQRNSAGLPKNIIGIQYAEVLADKVYVEYTDGGSDYISFSKANILLKESSKELIRYTCVDNQKAIDFINSVLAGIEIEAIVEQADSREHIFEIKKTNIFYDLVFLDIPYSTGGQRGGGVNPKRNMADYALIDPEEFGEILKGVESKLRSEESQVIFMIAGGKSSALHAQKYIRMFDQTSLLCNDVGSYTKLTSTGKVCNMAQYDMPPEIIMSYSPDGKVRDCTADERYTLDFALERPKLARFGGYPTAKPLAMLRQMVAQATQRGEWVLDLFGGSGNMLEAALGLGRRAHIVEVCPAAINDFILPKLAMFADGEMRRAIQRPTLF